MSNKIQIHKRNLSARLEYITSNKHILPIEKKELQEFVRLAGIGKVNLGNKIGESRLVKYLDLLIIPLQYFKKSFSQLNNKDIETFIESLETNKLKKKNKEFYADSTKIDIKRVFKIYLKYRIKNIAKVEKLTNWIDLKQQKKTPEYLKESEVMKLYKNCNSAKKRFIVSVLFDSGCRAEELLNIRLEDIFEPTENNSYYKICFKEEYSKTKGRTIGLYWKHSTEAIKDYLSELKSTNPKEPILNDTYDSIRVFVNRLGKKILNKRVHLHLFRHSSATYYASQMNRQQLCIRYGWNFTSDMPDIYIARAGLEEKEVEEKFKATDISKLQNDLEQLKEQMRIVTATGTKAIMHLINK